MFDSLRKLIYELKINSIMWPFIVFVLLKIIILINFFFLKNYLPTNNSGIEISKLSIYVLIPVLFSLAFIEELLFRSIPFKISEKLGLNPWTLLIPFSILFGLLHGNFFNIPIQGLAGIAYSYLYINYKNNNPLLITTIFHFLWNFIVILI